MSQLALISDIHGNGVALDTVLADLARHDVEQIVCLGDVAAGGPQPNEVIARLRELGCQAVRGNADGWLLDGLPAGRSEETRRLGEVVGWAHMTLAPDDGGIEISFRRLPVDVGALAAATVPMPCPTWAADLERRIRRWNARAR